MLRVKPTIDYNPINIISSLRIKYFTYVNLTYLQYLTDSLLKSG